MGKMARRPLTITNANDQRHAVINAPRRNRGRVVAGGSGREPLKCAPRCVSARNIRAFSAAQRRRARVYIEPRDPMIIDDDESITHQP